MHLKTIIKIYLIFITLGLHKLQAQQQFSLQGDATSTNPTTFRLTSNNFYKAGKITNLYPKDVTQNFDIDFEANFGTNNENGADGIAVIFSKECNPNLARGKGLGASGISNSIIIEFDTYQNGPLFFDIPNDHITIFKNGLMNSANQIMDTISQPVCALPSCNNIENGNWYNIKIRWEYESATSQKVSVFFNGNLRATSTRNHIATSFQGNTKVFNSISASTGASRNLQQVRTSDNSVVHNVCNGSPVTLLAPEFGSNYQWSNGTSTTFLNTFIPTTSGIINCTYKDFCNITKTITFTLNLKPTITPPVITTNSPICNNGNAIFTLTGFAGTVINYTLNAVSNTTIIPASGSITITKNNANSNVELKLLQISNLDCAISLNNTTTIIIASSPVTSPIIEN